MVINGLLAMILRQARPMQGRKILGTHARYNRFLDDGDAHAYEARLEEFRVGAGQGQVTTARQRFTPVRAGAIRGAPRGNALSAHPAAQRFGPTGGG